MDKITLDSLSPWVPFAELLVTVVGLIFLIIEIRQTGRSISKSIEGYSYDVWRTVYERLAAYPKVANFFNFKLDRKVDPKMLSCFLMVLDMYANMFSGRYTRLSSEATLLQNIMKSDTSRQYWSICRDYFFSDKDFIREIDNLAKS